VTGTASDAPDTGVEILKAYAPYLVIIALFSLFQNFLRRHPEFAVA